MEQQRTVLSVNGIEVIYNHVILVLKGVSLTVQEGTIVSLLGGNGAGKTTTLRAVSNLLQGERGAVTKGSIELRGERIENLSPSELVQRGVVQVMEGRHCFAHLTIEENLLTGAYTVGNKAEVARNLEKVYTYFPRLKTRREPLRLGFANAVEPGLQDQLLARGRLVPGAAALGDIADPPAHLPRLPAQVAAGHGGRAAVGLHQRGEHAQRGRLARAVGTEEAEDLAFGDLQVNPADRLDGLLGPPVTGAERLPQTLGLDDHCLTPPSFVLRRRHGVTRSDLLSRVRHQLGEANAI